MIQVSIYTHMIDIIACVAVPQTAKELTPAVRDFLAAVHNGDIVAALIDGEDARAGGLQVGVFPEQQLGGHGTGAGAIEGVSS